MMTQFEVLPLKHETEHSTIVANTTGQAKKFGRWVHFDFWSTIPSAWHKIL